MSPEDNFASIADASRPNAGRIYDYLLGGNHNFEIDRQAAEKLLKIAPEMRHWVRLVRWFLGEAVRRLVDAGFTHFVDFASGLPTVDHIHQIAPKSAKVIYSDIDPVTVAYAQELVRNVENVSYMECNAAEPERLLNSKQLKGLFGEQRKVAVGLNGICWFLTDEQIAHAADVLYRWADKGSTLFLCDINNVAAADAGTGTVDFYKQVGQPVYLRDPKKLTQLLGKWRIEQPGFRPLEEWIDFDKHAMEEATSRMGGNLVGAIVTK